MVSVLKIKLEGDHVCVCVPQLVCGMSMDSACTIQGSHLEPSRNSSFVNFPSLFCKENIVSVYYIIYINSRIVFLFLTKLRLYFFTGCTKKDENHEIRLNLNSSVSEIKDIKFKHILCPSEQIFYPPFSPECFHPLVNLTCRRPYSR